MRTWSKSLGRLALQCWTSRTGASSRLMKLNNASVMFVWYLKISLYLLEHWGAEFRRRAKSLQSVIWNANGLVLFQWIELLFVICSFFKLQISAQCTNGEPLKRVVVSYDACNYLVAPSRQYVYIAKTTPSLWEARSSVCRSFVTIVIHMAIYFTKVKSGNYNAAP